LKAMSSSKTPDSAKKPVAPSNATSRAGQPTTSARGTPKSPSGRASPPKPTNRSASSTKKPQTKKSNIHEANPIDEYTRGCPPGLYRIYLTPTSQQTYNLRMDEDVTQEDNIRTIQKQLIIDDISKREAGSDFHPIKQFLESYQNEEVTIIYDYEFTYDKNFLICLTKELKEIIDNPPIILPPETQKEPPKYMPPVSKPWVTFGSEKEIDEERFVNRRPLFTYEMKIIRDNLKRPVKFKDVDDKKDSSQTISSVDDQLFKNHIIELNKAIQAAPEIVENSAQTQWKYPKNASTQYEPRTMDEKESQKILSEPYLNEFSASTLPMFSSALQQNEIMNAFADDWQTLGEEMTGIGGPGDVHLKEYQSFTDIHNSKNKVVTCVQWHPSIKGIVAMSLASNFKLYERIDNFAKSVVSSSLILIWSFFDPIQPKLFLEAPCDVFSFAFSPTEPHIVAGGCINGQVALWDIKQYEDRIINPRGDHREKDLFIPGFEDDAFFQTPRIRYCALSALEFGHTAPITHLTWIPDHFEVDRNGFPTECRSGINSQIMTASIDHQILFWDTKAKNQVVKQPTKKDPDLPMGVSQLFKHLVQWKPFLRVTLPCSDPGGDFSPTKFTISERQGDKSIVDSEDKENDKPDDPSKGQFVTNFTKPGSGKSRLLQHLNTRISIGTEDGQFVYVDWIPTKDSDTNKVVSSKAEWYSTIHDGPIVAMKHSPFFKDIVLVAGGTAFSIWREKVFFGPLLQTSSFSKRVYDAEWSPSRAGVFFIAKSDGSIDVWDMLDRTHAPILTQSISINPLTYISCKATSSKQQLIAIGDNTGTLHIMEVPWSLRRNISGELQAVKSYLNREGDRRDYVKKRWDFREKEKDDMQKATAAKAGLGPPHIPNDDEITFKLRNEYNEFLQFEAAILREMGLKDDDEPPALLTA